MAGSLTAPGAEAGSLVMRRGHEVGEGGLKLGTSGILTRTSLKKWAAWPSSGLLGDGLQPLPAGGDGRRDLAV